MTDAGYAIVPRWILKDDRFTGQMIATYLALQSYADADGSSFPSVASLAKRARLGPTSTRAALRALEEIGVVQTTFRRLSGKNFQSSTYLLLTHDPGRVDPPSPRDVPPNASRGTPPREALGELTPLELNPIETIYGPAGARLASESQVEWLKDLHIHGGGSAGEIDGFVEGLSGREASSEIREALAALPRGRSYRGHPRAPGLSAKGIAVAEARMVPGVGS